MIDAIVDALEVDGARVVFAEADPDHHRLDTTVLGSADAVARAAVAGSRRRDRSDRPVRAPRRPPTDGRGRRRAVHARPRGRDGGVRRARSRGRAGAGRVVLPPRVPVRRGRGGARAPLARRRTEGRVRGAPGGRRGGRSTARLRSARDRSRGCDRRGGTEAARRLQHLPARDGRGGGEGDRPRGPRVHRRSSRRSRDRLRGAGTRVRHRLHEPRGLRGDRRRGGVRRRRGRGGRARAGGAGFRDRRDWRRRRPCRRGRRSTCDSPASRRRRRSWNGSSRPAERRSRGRRGDFDGHRATTRSDRGWTSSARHRRPRAAAPPPGSPPRWGRP